MKKRKFYFFPKTKIGKISFWLVILSFIGLYLQYWIAMAFNLSIPFLIGLLPMIILIITGITSIISIIKHKDYALSLFISSLIGILGILFVIANLFFPH